MGRRRPGSGSVELRGGSFELRYHDGEKRRRKVLGRADEIDMAEARRRADDLLHGLKPGFAGADLTVARLFADLEPVMRSFLGAATVRDRMLVGGMAARFFGPRPARTIDVPAAQDFMASLAGRAANTIRGYRARLAQVWALGHERGLLAPANPWRSVRVPRAEESAIVPVSREDVEQLAPFLYPRRPRAALLLADLLRFLVETGLRCGEANRLVWEDVRGGRVLVRRSKTGRSRSCAMSAQAQAVLASIRMRGGLGERVFRGILDGPGYRRTRLAIHRGCRFAGVALVNLHQTRHGFACALAEAGVVERDLAPALGQRDHESAARYVAHGNPDAAADRAIRRLEAHRSAASKKAN